MTGSDNHDGHVQCRKHCRVPPRPSIDPSMMYNNLFPILKINIPIKSDYNHESGLVLNNGGTILEASTGKSIARVSTMTLVALECMAFIDIISKCRHDDFTDNITVTVDKNTLDCGCQSFICDEFYEEFIEKRPQFPWGGFKTKQERLNGICINDTRSIQQDTRGLVEVCNDMVEQLKRVL